MKHEDVDRVVDQAVAIWCNYYNVTYSGTSGTFPQDPPGSNKIMELTKTKVVNEAVTKAVAEAVKMYCSRHNQIFIGTPGTFPARATVRPLVSYLNKKLVARDDCQNIRFPTPNPSMVTPTHPWSPQPQAIGNQMNVSGVCHN